MVSSSECNEMGTLIEWLVRLCIGTTLLESNLAKHIKNLKMTFLAKCLMEHKHLASPLCRFPLYHQWNVEIGKYLDYATTITTAISTTTTNDNNLNPEPQITTKVGKWVSEGQGRSEICYFPSNSGIIRCYFTMGKIVCALVYAC